MWHTAKLGTKNDENMQFFIHRYRQFRYLFAEFYNYQFFNLFSIFIKARSITYLFKKKYCNYRKRLNSSPFVFVMHVLRLYMKHMHEK